LGSKFVPSFLQCSTNFAIPKSSSFPSVEDNCQQKPQAFIYFSLCECLV
jgi:hypothetical protein